jgi:hypothetical protein
MATTAKHNKGAILQYVEESTYGVDPGSGYKDLRIEGDPEVSGQFSKSVQPETLFANAWESEKPVLVSVGVEGTPKFNVGITRGATAGTNAQLKSLMQSAGWTEDSGADTTVATATSQTQVDLSAAEGASGRGLVVQLGASASGNFWPVLCSSVSGVTTTFACGLPSVTDASNPVNQCHTFIPGAVGPASTSLTMRHITKALNSTDNVMGVFTGVSVSAIGDLEIMPGTMPYLEMTCNSASHNVESLAGGMPANSFTDGAGKKPADGTYVQFATANASGAIASATVKLLSATVGFGSTTSQIPGIGDSECVYNTQGNRQDPGDFVGTLKFLYDADRISDWEGTNESKYIGIVQQSANTTQPPWAFIMPNAHIMEDPVWENSGDDNMHIVTVKYKANPAGYNSATAEGNQANAPMYFLVGTESA